MAKQRIKHSEIIVGVDTHKNEHVAVALDGLGGQVSTACSIPATIEGYKRLLVWADGLGKVRTFAVEGCGSYGSGLARFLRRHGRQVQDVPRPPRRGERRLAGKSDAIDAEHAAREVLAGSRVAIPKSADGEIESIRLLKIARDTAVKAQATTMVTLKAVLVTAEHGLRDRLEPLSNAKLISSCSTLRSRVGLHNPKAAMRQTLGSLARRWNHLAREIKGHTAHLKTLTERAAPVLLQAYGVGFDSAAELLIAVGDNRNRIRSESAFAKLCGVCPIPAGSGKTSGRHRLNRGGNRQANAALYRIVIVRMRWHAATIAYVQRRTAEGLGKRDIIRCLKRFVAREAYRLMVPPQERSPQKIAS